MIVRNDLTGTNMTEEAMTEALHQMKKDMAIHNFLGVSYQNDTIIKPMSRLN